MPNDNEICANCGKRRENHESGLWMCDVSVFKRYEPGKIVPASLLDKVRALLPEMLDIIQLDIEAIGPCEHDANVCMCGLVSCAERITELREALAEIDKGE